MGLKEMVGKLVGGKKSAGQELLGDQDASGFEALMAPLLEEAKGRYIWYFESLKMGEFEGWEHIKALSPEEKAWMCLWLCTIHAERRQTTAKRTSCSVYDHEQKFDAVYRSALNSLLRMKCHFPEDRLIALLRFFRDSTDESLALRFTDWPVGHAVIQLEKHVKADGLSDGMRAFVEEAVTWKEFDQEVSYWGSDVQKSKLRLQALVFDPKEAGANVQPFKLKVDDVFAPAFTEALEKQPPEFRDRLFEICHQAITASGSKPSRKFQQAIAEILKRTDTKKYKELLQTHLGRLASAEPCYKQHTDRHGNTYNYGTHIFLAGKTPDLVKGLVWSLSQFHDEATLDTLARLAERSFKKMPGIGPTCAGVGNACLFSLAHSKGLVGMSHLSRLKLRITQNNTRKLIQKYIEEGSKKRGISPAELEELAVPDFGLVDGVREEQIEGFTLRLSVTGIGKTAVEWFTPEGKPQKSTPAAVKSKKASAEKARKLKATAKQVQKYLTAQRDRIDRSYIDNREWSYENFRKYYLDHGLVGFVARRLIWTLHTGGQATPAVWHGGQWEDVTGSPVGNVGVETRVRLWHPLDAGTENVLAWRERLEALEIRQPMKQAHREVYILTDAELNTRLYSNRMAAHILKQHQFNSLAGIRGWKYQLLGAYDDGRNGEIARLDLPAYGLRAEFWINEIYDDNDSFNEAGIWDYVATDQVRFVADGQGEPMELVEVPKLVFSEIMRDVDLFVGVGSVANDPTWQDSGGQPRHMDYWQSFSFGDLTEVAKTRRAVLERLVPRLKIRDVARIDGKFLRVQGKVREYKIHIGSGNILMEPNDQYLCIVPGRGKAGEPGGLDKVFLPFEGDRGLSLVLSKAMLLADDTKITDPTILSQIKHR